MKDITDEEIEKLNRMLMHAYNELCRAEKMLKGMKGSDSNANGEATKEFKTD